MNIRKMASFFLAALLVTIIFVGIPLLLIFLNKYFDLPVYTSIFSKIIGMIFLVVGLSVVIYSTVLHIKTGRLTVLPIIEQPKQFIVNGFYKYCRNPMYLAEVIIYLGIFLLLGYILLLLFPVVVFLTVNLFVIYIEEPELCRTFGQQYIGYTKKVTRWIPKSVN